MSDPNAKPPEANASNPPAKSEAIQPAAPGTAAPLSAAAAKPATAPKPAAAAKPAAKPAAGTTRRGFIGMLTWINVGWVTLGAWTLGTLAGSVRFLFPNVSSEPPSKVDVGPKDQFEEGKVDERFKDQNMWVVRYQGQIYALSTTCTHLGCTPNWLEREEKFKCPCHGSGFKITGINFEGPAPRPLERWKISVVEGGDIVVDKSKKFQWERGEWDNPESFLNA